MWLRYPREEVLRMPPLVLAYVGDAVFELYVRNRLAAAETKLKSLHRGAVGMVNARSMAVYYGVLEPHLSAAETEVLHRGRNVKTRTIKSARVGQYHRSTGFEALLGYLFLSAQEERLAELLELLLGENHEQSEE